MKRKSIIALSILVISVSLCACNNNTNETANNDIVNSITEESSTVEESFIIEESSTVEESTEALRQETQTPTFSYAQGALENEKSENFLADSNDNGLSDNDNNNSSVNSTSDTVISEEEYRKLDELAGTEKTEITTNEDMELKPEDLGFETEEEMNAWLRAIGYYDDTTSSSNSSSSNDIPQAAKDMYVGDGYMSDDVPDSTFGQGDYSDASTTGHGY